MKILLAKNNGFCFGVRRAVEMAIALSNPDKPVYTYGSIIHNEDVVGELKEKNVHAVKTMEGLKSGDTLIIRAHGVPPEVYREAEERGLNLKDATCPFVKKIHRIVEKETAAGRRVLIAGEEKHPEVIGIRGWAGELALVLEKEEDAAKIPGDLPVSLVAQTTLSREQYAAISKAVLGRFPDAVIHKTICDTTRARQAEAVEIAKRCSRVFVLGSQTSANTQRLASLCRENCKNTDSIDNIGKLFLDNLQSDDIIGIVAGASTPDRMIREVIQSMSELEKTTIETIEAAAPAEACVVTEETKVDGVEAVVEEAAVSVETAAEAAECCCEEKAEEAAEAAEEDSEFAAAFEKTMMRIRNGQVLPGTVISVVDGEVFVNIGYKSDGFIPKNEFSSDPDVKPEEVVKEGDKIEVEVLKVNDGEGNVLLSRKNVEGKKLWEELVQDPEIETKIFEATGKEVVKGGVIADINGIRAFVPASQVSTKYVENLNEYVGKPMKLKVLEVDKDRKRIVASQKQVMIAEAAAAKKAKWEALEVGSKVQGVVRRITDFGAFVDIGGIDGLVHVTDAAWGRVKHPSDVLSINQEIEVLILNVDVEKERVSLGYKQLQPKPWTMADQKYPVGSIVEGKVVRIVPFGAFVALESTIDGLIHISQVDVRRVAKVEDVLNVGDVVRCKVLEVNPEAKRISLSRKEAILEENPEVAEQLAAEKAERDRQYAERQEQRNRERESNQQATQQRRERPARSSNAGSSENYERRERSVHRHSEDGEYDLPPVQTSTTSLADLFKNFKAED